MGALIIRLEVPAEQAVTAVISGRRQSSGQLAAGGLTPLPLSTSAASQPTTEGTATRGVALEKRLVGHSPLDSFSVKAPSNESDVRATQSNQLSKLADGMRDGSISAGESQKILKEQQSISDTTKTAMRDGKLSGDERRKLGMMQTLAGMNLSDAAEKGVPELGLRLKDADPSRQADQIDTLADGISNGNITRSESSKLLGQQSEISEARGPSAPFSSSLIDLRKGPSSLDKKLDAADRDLSRHSKPGNQVDLKSLFDGPRFPGAIVKDDLPLRNEPLKPLIRDSGLMDLRPILASEPKGFSTGDNS